MRVNRVSPTGTSPLVRDVTGTRLNRKLVILLLEQTFEVYTRTRAHTCDRTTTLASVYSASYVLGSSPERRLDLVLVVQFNRCVLDVTIERGL